MSEAILDGSALLAVVRRDTGAEEVEQRLGASPISAVNLSEVVAKAIGYGGTRVTPGLPPGFQRSELLNP